MFCIPQDGSELAKVEIGRQAAIFGNATRAICWMSGVEDLEGVQWAVTWVAMAFAHCEDPGNDDRNNDAFLLVDAATRPYPGIGARGVLSANASKKYDTPAPWRLVISIRNG